MILRSASALKGPAGPMLWRRGRPRPFGNQPRTPLPRQIRPEPLRQDAEPVLKLWQREHVQRGPHQPGHKAAAVQMAGLEDGEGLADHRHIAFVAVPKRSTILASSDTVGNDMPDKSSLLNGCLRHSGDGVTILGHRGCISHDKDVGCLGYVPESAEDGAPGAVRRRPEHFYERRGANACCPKHGGAGNPDASRDHALLVNLLDLYAGRNFNPELR